MGILKLGPVRQVGYVVKDVEKAMQEWVRLGVGPWFYTEKVPVEDFQYMGKPYDLNMSVALTHSGYIQVELIQQRNDAPSLYRDFLETRAEGRRDALRAMLPPLARSKCPGSCSLSR